MRLRVIVSAIMLTVAVSGVWAVVAPKKAEAIPAFSRQTGKPCSTCHDVIPKLNQTGQNFRTNGFRFPEDREWRDAQNLKYVPHSAEIEVEAEFNQDRSGNGGSARSLSDINGSTTANDP